MCELTVSLSLSLSLPWHSRGFGELDHGTDARRA